MKVDGRAVGIRGARFSGAPRALAAIVAAGLAAGCAGLQPMGGENIVARDVLEIKHLIEGQKEESSANQRKIEYRLDTLAGDLQTRSDLIKSNLDDVDKTSRAQAEEIEKLRKQVEGLSYQLASIANRMGMPTGSASAAASGNSSSSTIGAEGAPPSSGSPSPSPLGTAPALPISADDAYLDAEKDYNLGRYDAAREKLDALAARQDISPDLFVKSQFMLAESCYALGDATAAYENYRRVIDNRPPNGRGNPAHALAWRSLERMGMINQKRGDKDQALKFFDQILAKNPGYEGADRVKERVRELRGGDAPPAAPSAAQPESPAPAQP